MLLQILIVIAVLLVILIAVIAARPSEFRVTRSVVIAAPPDAVFEQVNNLHHWEAWSPWAKLDPAAKNTYEGPPAGTGAAFAWSGNRNIGEGRMTIIESVPPELVRFRLDFVKPFKGTNLAEFTFKAEGGKTTVTWSMSGKNNFITKGFGLFINCEKMVGGQFDRGLAQIKELTEAKARTPEAARAA
jgi:uncharacterized protein YndB with AHSA1/START domain